VGEGRRGGGVGREVVGELLLVVRTTEHEENVRG